MIESNVCTDNQVFIPGSGLAGIKTGISLINICINWDMTVGVLQTSARRDVKSRERMLDRRRVVDMDGEKVRFDRFRRRYWMPHVTTLIFT